jgi:hypothetical protein
LASFGCLSSASAGLIVSVSDLTLPAGDTGFVDVNIRSDSGDLLQFFQLELRIEPVGVPGTRLEFTAVQPDPQLTDPDYVFFGDSFAQIVGVPVGSVSTAVVPGDTFSGGDFTFSFSDVVVGATDELLARLEVTADTGLPPIPGDQFTVSVISANSFFVDSQFSLNGQFNPIPFDSTPGTVTIASATVIPEPASLTLFCLGGLGIAAARHRRLRRRTA